MSVQALREFINRHNASAAGLAALGAALDAKASGTALEAPLGDRVDDLLAAIGSAGMLADMSAEEVKPFLGELRAMFALDAKLLDSSTRTIGWRHTEPEILQSVGDTSAGFVQGLSKGIVPNLEGLTDRFSKPGAAFLDVGVGVASLAIAAARVWPALRIVGLDLWQPSLALARENVSKAGLGDRIELREQRAEELTDDGQFDLAWFPTNFVPEHAVRPACERIHRALRAGGWMLFVALNPSLDPQGAAVWRLRTTLHGNVTMPDSAAAERLLRDVGLVDVKTMPSPPGAFISVVVGRR